MAGTRTGVTSTLARVFFRLSVLPAPDEKAAYVRRMFDRIAARYDRMNRLMTFGLDQGWRRFAVSEVAAGVSPSNRRVVALDVGTGTGDFLPILRQQLPGAVVVGADFSLPMMRAGRSKAGALHGAGGYVAGDGLCLPFGDNTFDAVTTGFTMRNVADLHAALGEMRRVARPGARLACLEVAQPAHPVLHFLHRLYFNRVVPIIGAVVGGNRQAYTYLPQSAERFPPPDELCDLFRAAGWRHPRYRLLGFGAVAVHTAEK